MPYYPLRDHWETQPPADLRLSPERLAAAVEYHRAHETRWRRDFITASGRYIGVADEPPAPGDVLGPVEKLSAMMCPGSTLGRTMICRSRRPFPLPTNGTCPIRWERRQH
jgi:hypothetical protein